MIELNQDGKTEVVTAYNNDPGPVSIMNMVETATNIAFPLTAPLLKA